MYSNVVNLWKRTAVVAVDADLDRMSVVDEFVDSGRVVRDGERSVSHSLTELRLSCSDRDRRLTLPACRWSYLDPVTWT